MLVVVEYEGVMETTWAIIAGHKHQVTDDIRTI